MQNCTRQDALHHTRVRGSILLCSYIKYRQWDDLDCRMGLVEGIMGQEGSLMADPCAEEQMTSNNEKINDVGKNDWLKLQDQANLITTR